MALWHDEARRRGATRAFLEVATDNAPARALYDAAGYRPAGLRRGYYPRPRGRACDALILTRELTQRQAPPPGAAQAKSG